MTPEANRPATRSAGDPPMAAPPEPSAVLVRTPNWLGDLMVSTAFVRAVLARFPDVPVDLIVRRGFDALPLPHRGRVIPYDKRHAGPGAFGRSLRGAGYSHAFVLPPSFSSAWMAFRGRIPHRIGHGGGGRGWLLRPALAWRRPPRSVHLVQEYLDLLRPWGAVDPQAHTPGLEIDDAWIAAHLPPPLAEGAPYVVLAPGAEYGTAKQWPAPHYRRVAEALSGGGRRVVAMGLPGERALGESIVGGLPGGLNLCGETDLPGLVAALARAALLISNDSGAMHVTAALGRPQIALFGSTNPDWTAPLNSRARLLYRAEPCSPCYGRTCRLGHTRCLWELQPGEAIAAAEELLREG